MAKNKQRGQVRRLDFRDSELVHGPGERGDDNERYRRGRLGAIAGVGLVGMVVGHYHDTMPKLMHFQIAGYMPLGSSRHWLPAAALTLFSELYCNKTAGPMRAPGILQRASDAMFSLAMKNEKATAVAVGLVPSVLWEAHQYHQGGPFSWADIATGAAVGALVVGNSTHPSTEIALANQELPRGNA